MATNVTTVNPLSAISGLLAALLPALGVAPGVLPIITGLLAAATVGPEVYNLLKQDIDLFAAGNVTADQLAARFSQVQTTFESLAARWKDQPAS